MISHKPQAGRYSFAKVKSAKLATFTLKGSSCQNGNLIFLYRNFCSVSSQNGNLPYWGDGIGFGKSPNWELAKITQLAGRHGNQVPGLGT